MAIKTYTEQLESVQTAIAKLEETLVSSFTHGDKTVIKQKLDVLYNREQYLRDKVSEENANNGNADGPITVRGIIPIVN